MKQKEVLDVLVQQEHTTSMQLLMNDDVKLTKQEEKRRVLKSIKGFNIVKRDFDDKIYLQHICHKENSVIAELLATRGVKPNEKANFLEPKLKNLLPNAGHMKSTDIAAERIIKAINEKEKICIFGDYDVDGSTSTAMWILFLQQLNIPVSYYIPDRIKEGYGPNSDAIKMIAKSGVKLIISVDCGTTAFEPFNDATKMGMDAVIIDHHQSNDELPNCIACVNPNRLDETDIVDDMRHLCACGVSFFVIMAINSKLKQDKRHVDLMQFTPLVAFATICDVMKLTPLNRAFVKTGLHVLQKNSSFNLMELIYIHEAAQQQCHVINSINNQKHKQPQITAGTFGFLIGPMVNAGGRIGKSSLGVELMIENDKQTAREIAEKLYYLNEDRKYIESEALRSVVDQKQNLQEQIKNNGFIMLYSAEWHEGVIGLMASRIKDRYFYPVFIGSESEDGMIKFSSRSISGVDIGAIILEAKERGLIMAGGGHKMAGGCSCKKNDVDKFKHFLKEKIKSNADNCFLMKQEEYDVAISLGGLSCELLDKVSKFEPFGVGNPRPLFLLQNVVVKKVDVIKDKHIAISIHDDSYFERAMCFNCIGSDIGKFLLSSQGKNISLLVSAENSEWKGQLRKNIKIEDVILQ